MAESYEHNLGDHEDPLPGPTWTVGIVGGVALAVSLLGVSALLYDMMGEERQVKILDAEVPTAVEVLHAQQLQRLQGPPRLELRPGNLEGEASLVIPIEDAMRLVVQEAQGQSPPAP